MRKVRQLPAVDKRVETGAVQFEGDWPGLFIRGDHAMYLSLKLKMLLRLLEKQDFQSPRCMALEMAPVRQIIKAIDENVEV